MGGAGQSKVQIKLASNLLLCPSCMIRIPLIRLEQFNDNIYLISQCTCSKTPSKLSLKEYFNKSFTVQPLQKCFIQSCNSKKQDQLVFCLNCGIWICNNCRSKHHDINQDNKNHVYMKQELIMMCHRHNQLFQIYCEQCKIFICAKCIDDGHTVHSIPRLDAMESFIKQSRNTDHFTETCTTLKEEMRNRATKDETKTIIDECYEMNCTRNDMLKKLIKNVISTINFSDKFAIYPLIKTLEDLKFNFISIDKYCGYLSEDMKIVKFLEFLLNHNYLEVHSPEKIEVMKYFDFKVKYPNWLDNDDPNKMKNMSYDTLDFSKSEFILMRTKKA